MGLNQVRATAWAFGVAVVVIAVIAAGSGAGNAPAASASARRTTMTSTTTTPSSTAPVRRAVAHTSDAGQVVALALVTLCFMIALVIVAVLVALRRRAVRRRRRRRALNPLDNPGAHSTGAAPPDTRTHEPSNNPSPRQGRNGLAQPDRSPAEGTGTGGSTPHSG